MYLLDWEVPAEFGGSEAGEYRFNAVLGEELSRSGAALAFSFGIHFDCAAPYLVTKIWAGSNEIMNEIIGRDLGL